ncbi:E3 ubiquitin-protein ligase MARCHF4-like [Dermacentor andersoni]|uniref:E3 ubiquitin-protein ligase MARCHF4-like n=1 Tax=Dermacentor andersoni TaxID=34620 RepID=UPI0024178F62|nr:E3 ubiquitin-protein ligase MARCHF3-like [Dermacentor andersoni]
MSRCIAIEDSQNACLGSRGMTPVAPAQSRASTVYPEAADPEINGVSSTVGTTAGPSSSALAATVVLPMDDLVTTKSSAKEHFGPDSSALMDEAFHDHCTVCEIEQPRPLSLDSVSLSSDAAPTCRICFSGGGREPLLEPCHCRGTIGFVHRECLELWIRRTVNPQCQVCHFQYTVRKEAKPAWRLLSDAEARRPVLGYLVLGTLFVISTAFVFSLAWLYAVRLPARVGNNMAAVVVVLLSVLHFLWLYFPFVSFV